MPLALSSAAFAEGGQIPERYTRDGKNVSPPLKWSGVPDEAKSLV
ncbi:YbhB/YbcL family Raf kinase inhibitor-like protein, partial [Mesorhizobium sp. M7A.F.Ca.CA.004.06.1.1]